MNDERTKILGRIREALTLSAPHPGHHGDDHAASARDHRPDSGEFRAWLPEVGTTEAERIALFAKHSEALKTEFIEVADEAALREALGALAAREGWSRVASHHAPLTDACAEAAAPAGNLLWADGGYDTDALEVCDAGITCCDLLVAQTGTAVVSARSAGGRALSVLPPHHVVLATRDQLVADMSDAFARLATLYPDGYPSFLSFITGPSRTGDIERILVLGAHGPKKLTVILITGG